SGVLRKVWSFNGSDQLPEQADLQVLLSDIGWSKLDYRKVGDKAELLLPEGMELDFGGIGKEYAVDRALGLMLAEAEADETSVSVLVNLGGDMACSGLRLNGESWKVAIERPDTDESSLALLSLAAGGLATSGDSRRYLLKEGVRYSHVLNPKTGWPVESAPRSITVAAPSCVQSGLIATLALLQGDNAENFLRATGLRYWLVST
ncbi:MAG: FAD:protein FMN transferase, partial [Oceanospirillum sp.]|nr:FAD:protein FMN transferase [Oceanospirillum sp.]